MVAFLLGKNASRQEDLLPVLKKHRYEILFIDDYEKVWEIIAKKIPAIIFVSIVDEACLQFCRTIRTSEYSDYLTIVAYLDQIESSKISSAITIGLDEIIVNPCQLDQLKLQIEFAEKHAREKLNHLRIQDGITRSNLRQKSISKLGMIALSITDREQVIDEVLGEAKRILRIQYGEFLEYNPFEKCFFLKYGFGWNKGLTRVLKINLSENTQSGFTLKTGKPVVVTDYEREERFKKSELLKQHGIQSGISVLVPGTRTKHGILGVFSKEKDVFDDEDVNYVQTVSHILGQVIEWYETRKSLVESENRFHSSFENAPVGMVIVSPDGHLFDVNSALCEILGYSKAELLGMTVKDLSYPKDTSKDLEFIRKMLIGEINTYQIEKRYIHKSGKIIWALLSSSVVKDESGNIKYFVGQILDISRRKEIEEQLKKSENRFSIAFNAAPNPLAISRLRDGYIYSANESFLRFSGYSREEVIGKTSIELNIWPDKNDRRELLRQIDKYGSIQNYEMTFIVKGGIERKILLSMEGIELEGEKCLLTVISDVTERRLAEQKLRDSEARIRTILETTVDAIITFGESGTIKTFNGAAARMFGYSQDEVHNAEIQRLIPELSRGDEHGFQHLVKKELYEDWMGKGKEVLGLRSDGTTLPIDITVSRVELQGKTIFTAIIRDITERRALEQEILEISEQERRRIGQDLHDGLGQMLSGISLISQSLARKLKANALPGSDEVQEISELIQESDQYARNLARGLVPMELELNGIAAALEKLTFNVERLFGIRCHFQEKGPIHLRDNVVALHLYRIAQEAISNAVKHGKADKIELIISEEGDTITLQVKDNGLGIKKEREKNTGMGLRIMRYRARVINGTLDITSDSQNFTEVTCSIPIVQGTSAE